MVEDEFAGAASASWDTIDSDDGDSDDDDVNEPKCKRDGVSTTEEEEKKPKLKGVETNQSSIFHLHLESRIHIS